MLTILALVFLRVTAHFHVIRTDSQADETQAASKEMPSCSFRTPLSISVQTGTDRKCMYFPFTDFQLKLRRFYDDESLGYDNAAQRLPSTHSLLLFELPYNGMHFPQHYSSYFATTSIHSRDISLVSLDIQRILRFIPEK